MSNFPGSLDNDASLYVAKDNVATTLSSAMAASDTVAVVASPAGWAANMIGSVDSEQVLVTAVAGNVLTVTRAFNGTAAAAHASGRPFSNNVDAAYQQASKAAIIAIETALGANLVNVPAPLISAKTYNFAAQTPGGSLSIGANTITFPSGIPAGITAAAVSVSQLYISGGTGTAESVPVIGVNVVLNQVTVTCANTHSGAWTIQSSSAGIQEAAIFAGISGQIFIPSGTYPIKGTVTFLNGQSIFGAGSFSVFIRQDFASGNCFNLNNVGMSPAGSVIRGLTFTAGVSITSGWSINFIGGDGLIDDIVQDGVKNGVLLDAFTAGRVSNLIQLALTGTAVQIGGPTGPSGPAISNHQISGAFVGLNCISGQAEVSNFDYQITPGGGSRGILLSPTSPAGFSASQFSNGIIDSADIGIARTGTGTVASIAVSNTYIDAGSGGSSYALYFTSATGLLLSNIEIYGYGGLQTVYLSGLFNASLVGVSIADALAVSTVALLLNACVGVTVAGCQLGVLSSTGAPDATNTTNAIDITGASNHLVVTGNVFGGTTPVANAASPAMTKCIFADNEGLPTGNYIASETGANNAIAGALVCAVLAAGLRVTVQLAHTLQAGANTFNLNGGGAVAIKSGRNVANNIGTAYAATGMITLQYDGTEWVDISQ